MCIRDRTRTGEVETFSPNWKTTEPEVTIDKVVEKIVEGVDIRCV